MTERGPIEREFGVPFPGEILPPERHARTAWKKLPPPGPVDWQALFGRRAPLVLDLGCGNGRSTIHSALLHRDYDHVGLDILPVVIRYATRRANQRGLANIRFAVLGGAEFLARYVTPASIREIHVYHPQPYYDPAEVHKRLITPDFLSLVHQSLEPQGLFYLQTDNPGYWRYMVQVVPCFFDLQILHAPWPDAPRGRTRREILARQQSLPIFRGLARPRGDLDRAAVLALAAQLPPPTFDADRRLRALDRLE